ncbi:MAG: hypothetical protein LUD12_02865 [Lachnospiraceae bacterium]|nr:hypothetical protein [Lachnospiraceae bacterium]
MKVKRNVEFKTNSFLVGDIISFKLKTGEKVKAMAVDQDAEGTTFLFVNCLNEEYRMNPINTTEGGYEASELRKTLNTAILASFPKKIMYRMIPVFNGDLLTIPDKANIFENESQQPWEPMKQRRNRIAFRGENEAFDWYWLRDVISSAYFAIVGGNGNAYYANASNVLGVRPAFKIRNL